MKIYTLEELQKTAEALYFAKNPDLQAMLATEDGNFFYPNAVGHAKHHAKNGKVHVIEPSGKRAKTLEAKGQKESKQVKVSKPSPMTKKETLEAIARVKTEKELDELDSNFNLAKSKDGDIAKAFEEKENTFL